MRFSLIICCLFVCAFIGAIAHPLHDEVIFGTMHFDKAMLKKMADGSRPVLIKIDKEHIHGEQKDEYLKIIAKINEGGMDTRLIIGTAGVQGPDDVDPMDEMEHREGKPKKMQRNVDLAMQYNIMPKDCPTYLLWREGETYLDPVDPRRYKGPINADHIVQWVRDNGVYIADEGCFEEFDLIARKFGARTDKKEREQILADTEKRLTAGFDYNTHHRQIVAPLYVSVMKKILEKGNDYGRIEKKRIRRILKGELSENKAKILTYKSNIIDAFFPPPPPTPVPEKNEKDEL